MAFGVQQFILQDTSGGSSSTFKLFKRNIPLNEVTTFIIYLLLLAKLFNCVHPNSTNTTITNTYIVSKKKVHSAKKQTTNQYANKNKQPTKRPKNNNKTPNRNKSAAASTLFFACVHRRHNKIITPRISGCQAII